MKYLLIIAILLTGCINENCKEIGKLRCNKNKVEICSSKKRWKLSTDCNKVKGSKCGVYNKITTCVKKSK